MNSNIKTLIMLIGFAVLLGAAVFAYNSLSRRVTPERELISVESEAEPAAEPEPETEAKTEPEPQSEADNEAEAEAEAPSGEKPKVKAPDFTVLDADGNEVKLSDFLGTPVVLNFWASWCPPCKLEMPEFEVVYKDVGSDIQFMMVNQTDGQRETIEVGEAYIAEQGYTFPVYYDMELAVSMEYGVFSIPTTLFIDKDGYAVTGVQGTLDEETLRKGIELIK